MDTGAFALAGLDVHQDRLRVARNRAQRIELGVDAGLDHPTFTDAEGRVVGDCGGDAAHDVGDAVEPIANRLQQRTAQRRHRRAKVVDRHERVGERQAFARRCAAQCHACSETFEIGDRCQALRHLFEDGPRPRQLVDGVVAIEDRLAFFQRPCDPAAQRSGAHRGTRRVDHVPQRCARLRRIARLQHFQIRQRGGIEVQEIAFVVDTEQLHVIERFFVARRCVSQRGAGRADANVVFLQTESPQRLRREMPRQVVVRAGFLEH